MMTQRIQHFSPSLLPLAKALAAAALLLSALPALAQLGSSGNVYTFPGNLAIPNGPGNSDLGTEALFVGNAGLGSFSAMAGSSLRVGSLLVGSSSSGGPYGDGTVLIDGAMSSIFLVSTTTNRLNIGHQDIGRVTVSGGGTLNGSTESAACQNCSAYIGNVPGSSGTLTITGAGSSASFLGVLGVGSTFVDAPNFLGIPGGTTQAAVKILAGGALTTDSATIGMAPAGNGFLGTERSFSSVLIDGPGSVWKVTGGSSGSARLNTAAHQNAWATIDIRNGGKLWVDGPAGQVNGVALNAFSGGGRTDMLVTGVGSSVLFTGDGGFLNVGQNLGSATLGVTDGASISGVNTLAVGRGGSFGTLNVAGSGSQVVVDGVLSAAAYNFNNAPLQANMTIGRDGGTGVVNVTGGGNLSVRSTIGTPNGGAVVNIATGSSATSGTLNISGTGSVVSISAASNKNVSGVEQAFNPVMRVGRDGTGMLNVSAGGKLLIDGQAVSTNNDRGTSLYVGGRSDTANGGRGIASVTGAGSEIRLTGYDTYIGVGHGPQTFGQLTVSNLGAVSANGMVVGRRGGVGLLTLDNATVSLTGQNSYAPFLTLGFGLSAVAGSVGVAGTGTANIANGGAITISNMGTLGADLILGGQSNGPKGHGILNLAGGSSISVQAAPGLARARVGVNGTGLINLSGASSLTVGDGDLVLAQATGSVGTVIASENSSIAAGWVGIGRTRAGVDTFDGGVASMLLNSGATLTAQTVVIGTKGYLGGTAGSIVANQITNYGTFSPGSSPGTFRIDGNYTAEAGSRLILEVESNGLNGFNTDLVLFSAGSTINLNAGTVEFRFLGATDPNAFKASGLFNLDTFLALSDVNAALTPLATSAYAGTQFMATAVGYSITDFSYSAAGGAAFAAVPVPEPSAWAMMFAGITLLGAVAARRRKQQSNLPHAV